MHLSHLTVRFIFADCGNKQGIILGGLEHVDNIAGFVIFTHALATLLHVRENLFHPNLVSEVVSFGFGATYKTLESTHLFLSAVSFAI